MDLRLIGLVLIVAGILLVAAGLTLWESSATLLFGVVLIAGGGGYRQTAATGLGSGPCLRTSRA